MISSLKKFNFYKNNIFIILSFIVLSIISSFFIIKSGFVFIGSDMFFHWQRIYELKYDFINNSFINYVSLNMFNQSGSAVMTFYPNINLIPLVFLSFMVKRFIYIYYIYYICFNLISFILCYFSCYTYLKNKSISYIFSVTYTLSTVTMCHLLANYDIGISTSILLLPLVFFGLLQMLNNHNFIEFSVGMILIILSHVLSALIVTLFVLIFLLFNYNKVFKKEFVLFLLKPFSIIILITSFFWIPFLILSMTNNISMPPAPPSITGNDFNGILNDIFNVNLSTNLTIWALLGIVVSLVMFRNISSENKKVFWVSLLFLFICSDFFPWNILTDTFIKSTLQFSWRLYVVPQLLLTYLFSIYVVELIKHNRFKRIIALFIVLMAVNIQVIAQKKFVDNNLNNQTLTNVFNGEYQVNIKSQRQADNLIDGYRDGLIDYYPKQSVSKYFLIRNKIAVYDKNKFMEINLIKNGRYNFNINKRVKKFTLPFLYYNGIDYEVRLDGKTVKTVADNHSLLTLSNLSKGSHNVQIIVHRTKAEIVSYITTIIGILILGWALFKKYWYKNK